MNIKIIKIVLLLFLVLISDLGLANTYSQINYKLTPLFFDNKPILKVEAEIKGDISDQIILDLSHAWASGFYADQIKNVKLEYPKGKLQLKQAKENQAILSLPKTDILRLSYEMHQKHDDPTNVHEAIIRKNLIHSPGYGLFAKPVDLTDNDEVKFSVTWNNIPNKWQTISSYGLDKSLKFKGKIIELLDAVYVAGNLRVYQITDKVSPVYLSLYGQFDMKDNLIISFVSEIIKSQRAFFNDNDFPYYIISLIEGDNPNSMGGTGLTNSFTAYLPKGKNKSEFYILTAHEHLHNWIGQKIGIGKDEELNYWWSEGFTDYYSRVIALRSGGITLEEFIDECNQFFKDYYLSPVLNEPNSKIKSAFWKDTSIQKLPYYRGFVFAIYLNGLIKKNNINYSLDNVMLDLFKTAKQKEFSIDYFKTIVESYLPQGVDKEIQEFIDQGKTIDLNRLANILPIEKIKVPFCDLGFDITACFDEGIIKDIDIKSNAYKAGLRNGDELINVSLPKGFNYPDQIATVKTTKGEFNFRPESPNKKEIYQFKPKLSKEDKIKIKKFFGVE